ncbi:Golgi transport complex subunit 4 [Tilletia horrida]|nr:Golgi transport complex subunit 4 [Tilletia horrida]
MPSEPATPAAQIPPAISASSSIQALGNAGSAYTLPDPQKLTSPADVSSSLRSLNAHAANLDVQLAQKVTHSVEPSLEDAQKAITNLNPTLDVVVAQVDALKKTFAQNAATADKISVDVRKTEALRKRVAKSLEWARQVQVLKTALQLMVSCVERKDWDGAVKHCQVAMAVDPHILNSNFAAKTIPTSEFPDPPPQILLNLREELLRRFTVLFNTYARGDAPLTSPRQEAPSASAPGRDPEQATRFFKLFPQIGWREQGLQVYADFAGSLIRDYGKGLLARLGESHSKDGLLPHPQLLTSLFEPMARLSVTASDCAFWKLGWMSARYREGPVQYSIRPINPTTGLLTANNSGSGSPNPGAVAASGGPASTLRAAFPGITRPSTPLRSGTPQPRQSSDDEGASEGPDPREIDRILNELAALAARCAVYRRFLKARFGQVPQYDTPRDEDASSGSKGQDPPTDTDSKDANGPTDRALQLISRSGLLKEMDKLLRDVYVPTELWFLRASIEKAHRMDAPDPNSMPLSTPLPDDVFYVLRAVLARIVSTCPSNISTSSELQGKIASPPTGTAIVIRALKAVEKIMLDDYLGVIQRRLQGVWVAASGMMSVDGPRKEAASREMRMMFVTYLNVLETSATYIDRLTREIASPQILSQTYSLDEIGSLMKQMQSIAALGEKFRAAAKAEMDLLFTQIVRPRFRPILLEAYKDVSYTLNEDSYAEAEYADVVRRRFIKGWETVVVPYRTIFSEANYDAFIVTALEGLVRPWEKLVLGMRFTELGALRFDKDIRSLSTYLASQTAVGVREKFARLQQISYVLSLDPRETEEEVYESGITAGLVWSLLVSEIRQLLTQLSADGRARRANMSSRDSRAFASRSGPDPYAQARQQRQPSRYDGLAQSWQPRSSAAFAQHAMRNPSAGPSHQLLRHRSVSRLTDSWQGSGPHVPYQHEEVQPARSYSQAFPSDGPIYHNYSSVGRNATPSMTAGPSATPSSGSRNWADASRTNQYPAQHFNGDYTYPGPYYDARYAAPVPYINEVKAPHTGPRSSSIGPWLRNAYPGPQYAQRSSSVWSQSQAAGRGHDEAGPSRMREFHSPTYSRTSSAAHIGPYQAAGPFRMSRTPAALQRYSEHPSISDVQDFRATPVSSTPARLRHSVAESRRSVSTALPGSAFNTTALSYIQQALKKAADHPAPPKKVQSAAIAKPARQWPERGVVEENERVEQTHFDALSNAEEAEVHFAGEEGEESDGESPKAHVQIFDESNDWSQAEEVADFDDGDEVENQVTATAQANVKPGSKQAQQTSKVVKRATKKVAPQRTRPPTVDRPSGTASKSTIPAKNQLKRLSNWFIFSQKVKRLPKPVPQKLRTSPFNRMFDSDELGSTTSWIRVAGQLSSADLAQHVHDKNINIEDFKWETSLVIGARRARTSDLVGEDLDALIVTTSSGADYLLVGPMNLDATIEAGGLTPKFWRDFQESGGLGEEGWEALILRAYLDHNDAPPRSSSAHQTAHSTANASTPFEKGASRAAKSPRTAVAARPPKHVTFDAGSSSDKTTSRIKPSSSSSRPIGKARKTPNSLPERRAKSLTPSPSSKGGRRSRELAGLIASPFGTLTAVQEALQEMGLVVSASEDEDSDPIGITKIDQGTRRQTAHARRPTTSPYRSTNRPRLISVTSLKEQHLSDELSEASDSADEYREDEARTGMMEDDDSSEDEIAFSLGGKREAAKAELGSPSKRTSKRARTLASDRKWWEIPGAGASTTKPVPRAILEARRRENKSKRHTT